MPICYKAAAIGQSLIDGQEVHKVMLSSLDIVYRYIYIVYRYIYIVYRYIYIYMLNSNQFKFLGQHYLQMSGTAMGTKMAPSYANLFMGVLEKQMLSSYKHKPLVYFRYIDDIFVIWTDGEDSLNDFLTHCNNQNKNIQFEQTTSNTSIPFLDVSVTLEGGKLTTDLYCNSTDKHQYLYHTNCHPKRTKTSLPYCLALRLRRICSSENLFQQRTNEMLHHLIQRGYKKRSIHDAIKKASLVTREEADLLTKPNQNRSKESILLSHTTRCSLTYPRFYMKHIQSSMPLKDALKFSRMFLW